MTSDCLLIYGGFICFYQFLHMVALKIVLHNKCQNKNNFVSIFLQIIVNLQKSTNNITSNHGKHIKIIILSDRD